MPRRARSSSGGPPRLESAATRPSRASARAASRRRPRLRAEAALPITTGVAPPPAPIRARTAGPIIAGVATPPNPMPPGPAPEPHWPATAAALIRRVAALEALAMDHRRPSQLPTSGIDGSADQPLAPEQPSGSIFSEPDYSGSGEYGLNSASLGPPPQPIPLWPWPSTSTHNSLPQAPVLQAPWTSQHWPHPPVGCHIPPPWPTCGPYASATSGGPSLPLGDHLLQSTRDKIIRGEYIDLFSLLNRDSYPSDLSKLDELDKERARRKKPPRTWDNWLPAFIIYAGVLVRAQPLMALPLLHYLDIIYRARVDFPGDAWKFYDEEFRMRAALRPGMRWDEPNPALWLQYMTPSRPASGDRFDCGHLVQQPPEQHTTPRTGNSSTPSRTFCWEFAAHGRCNKKQCRYKHECLICSGAHGSSACPSVVNKPNPAPGASTPTPSLPSTSKQ